MEHRLSDWIRSRVLISVLLAAAACSTGTVQPEPDIGLDTAAPVDTVHPDTPKPPEDTIDLVPEDVPRDVPLPDVFDPGEILLEVLSPTICGCSIPFPEVPPQSCGWFSGQTMTMQVRAEHTNADHQGSEGIKSVRAYRVVPGTDERFQLASETVPDSESGYFTAQMNLGASGIPTDPETGGPVNGIYFLEFEARSKTLGPDDENMTESKTVTVKLDTIGPQMDIIIPIATATSEGVPRARMSGKSPFVFTGSDESSGAKKFQVYLDTNKNGLADEDEAISGEVAASDTEGPTSIILDLSYVDTVDTKLFLKGWDCIGNESMISMDVRVIGVPKFVTPPVLEYEQGTNTSFSKIKAVNLDRQDLRTDLLLVGEPGLVVAWGRQDNESPFEPAVLLIPGAQMTDVVTGDVTGDDVPDIVILGKEPDKEELYVYLWSQDTEGQGDQIHGLRTFTYLEKHKTTKTALAVDLVDVTGSEPDIFPPVVRPDVLVASRSEGESLAVLKHTGKTVLPSELPQPSDYLAYPEIFTGAGDISTMAHGDFNNDGAMDVVVGRSTFHGVTVFQNNGEGHFPMGLDSLTAGAGTPHLVVTELDEEGEVKLDLVVFNSTYKSLLILTGLGNGTFSSSPPSNDQVADMISEDNVQMSTGGPGSVVIVGSEIGSLVTGDFNGDGIIDLALTEPGNKLVAIHLGYYDNHAQFSRKYIQYEDNKAVELSNSFLNAGEAPGPMAADDFNHDGIDDIAVLSNTTGKVTLLLSDPLRGFHATYEIPMPISHNWEQGRLRPAHAVIGNFDPENKGNSLVVTTEPTEQEFWVPSQEEGEPPTQDKRNVPLFLTYLALARDNRPDFTAYKNSASYFYDQPITAMGAGYFDTDQYLDLAIVTKASPAGIEDGANFDILRGACHVKKSIPAAEDVVCGVPGRFWPLGGFIGPKNPTGLAISMLNDDELDDLVLIAEQTGNMEQPDGFQPNLTTAYLTDFDLNWQGQECPPYYQVHFPCCEPVDPVNTCLLPPSAGCPMGGACLGPISQVNQVGKDPVAVVAEDMDGDGVSDIMVVSRGSNNMAYFRGTQQGNTYALSSPTKPAGLFALGSAPIQIDVGYIDGDGYKDVVAALSDKISVSYGIDGVHFETPVYLTQGEASQNMTPTSVILADVNVDGYTDIVASSSNKSRIWIYVSGGERNFLGPYGFECGKNPVRVLEADFNRDSKPETYCPDLVVLNSESRSVSLLRNERCQ